MAVFIPANPLSPLQTIPAPKTVERVQMLLGAPDVSLQRAPNNEGWWSYDGGSFCFDPENPRATKFWEARGQTQQFYGDVLVLSPEEFNAYLTGVADTARHPLEE